jgi:hypothetical protein
MRKSILSVVVVLVVSLSALVWAQAQQPTPSSQPLPSQATVDDG